MVQLFIKQKNFTINDQYKIYNENEKIIYQAKSKFFSWASRIKLVDSNDQLLYYIKQKDRFTFYKQYKIFDTSNQLVCKINQKGFVGIKIKMKDGSGQIFKIDGDYLNSLDFRILDNDGFQIGSVIKRYLTWGDTYCLDISDCFSSSLFSAIIIVINDFLKNDNKNQINK